uniref:Uncharacterized protein n=1 Tax=Nothoprocta perdicaria TaxID=30464 RepID=A0A8C6ZF00_NOTPE
MPRLRPALPRGRLRSAPIGAARARSAPGSPFGSAREYSDSLGSGKPVRLRSGTFGLAWHRGGRSAPLGCARLLSDSLGSERLAGGYERFLQRRWPRFYVLHAAFTRGGSQPGCARAGSSAKSVSAPAAPGGCSGAGPAAFPLFRRHRAAAPARRGLPALPSSRRDAVMAQSNGALSTKQGKAPEKRRGPRAQPLVQ